MQPTTKIKLNNPGSFTFRWIYRCTRILKNLQKSNRNMPKRIPQHTLHVKQKVKKTALTLEKMQENPLASFFEASGSLDFSQESGL